MNSDLRRPLRRLILDGLFLLSVFDQSFHPLSSLPLSLAIPLLLLAPAIPLSPDLPSYGPPRPLDLFPLLAFLRLARDTDGSHATSFSALDVCRNGGMYCFEKRWGVDRRRDR